MTDPPSPEPDGSVTEDFRQTLRDVEQLYRDCADDYARRHPQLIQDAPDRFVARMHELHRGLVLKVFVEMAYADRRVGREERDLARDLFEHAWGRRLEDEQVKEALSHYLETTHLRWDSLLWPFEQLSSFRPHAEGLRALVWRLCRLVAHAGGRPDRRCTERMRWIDTQVQQATQRIPLAELTPPPPAPGRAAAQRQQDDFEITSPARPGAAGSVRVEARAAAESLDDVLADLDALVGLDAIKRDVRELVNFLKMQAERAKHGLPQTPLTLHAVFTGNPGTGKTTVARLFGRILGAMGILARGHLVETDRSGLVAEYAGQTAPKTNRRLDEALGGVLFIDEAYSLVAEGGEDAYGTEALQVLLKRMEDDRGRLVVILAGYPGPMERLLRSNPGLSSRFGRTFVFPDYSAPELGRIFQALCARDHYRLPARSRAKLLLGFRHLLGRRDEHFGNGRLARNFYERSVRQLANRLAAVAPLTRELLTTLQEEDVVLEGVPPEAYAGLAADAWFFRLTCPGCANVSRLPQKHLGRPVQCRRCGHEFEADWGEVADDEPGA